VAQNNEFEKHLAAMDLEVKHPWSEDANDLEVHYQFEIITIHLSYKGTI
jgi:hypothetical protein